MAVLHVIPRKYNDGEYWVVIFFAIKSVRFARFTDPGRTSFAAHDVTTAYGVIPA